MAQRITRLTTDQKIAGSNPAAVEIFCVLFFLLYISISDNSPDVVAQSVERATEKSWIESSRPGSGKIFSKKLRHGT